MSAAAVEAVRPGWRVAFSRARRPVSPTRWNGGPDDAGERPDESGG
jgi:hypothetical protein